MTNSKPELIIKTKVWLKENIELIDYLNTETIDNRFQVNSSGVIRRDKQYVTFQPGDNLSKTPQDLLSFNRNIATGKYIVNCGTWSKNLEKLVDENAVFMIYKSSIINELHGIRGKHYYKLSQGDIIKLGRMYLKVLDICLKKEKKENNTKNNNKLKSKYKGTMIHSSSSSCIFINGQQIIKGAFSPKWINNNLKHSQIIFNKKDLNFSNSILTARNKKRKNDDESYNIDLFAKKKLTALPRINSSNELFVVKKLTKKKNNKIAKDFFIEKPINLPKNKPTCRICYGDYYNDENPLICPCVCKGSMKYIHYLCLKNWLNSKIEEELSEDETEKDNMECITYKRSGICCELCKTKYPDYIIHNNIYYNILFYKPKFQEYIIFESMRVGRDKIKNYHVVTFDDRDYINIGRATECELSLAELSVSRFHCLVHKDNGQAFLEDNTSKFGTLVLVQNKNMIINEEKPLRLQVNKTYIKFKLELPFSFSLNCCGPQETIDNAKLDYHVQNKKGFDILSFFIIKDDSNVWGIDDDNEEDIKINKEKDNEINTNANVIETQSKIGKELIDSERDNGDIINEGNNIGLNLNIINDINNNKNNVLIEEENKYIQDNEKNKNKEENKEKESLIDKSIVDEKKIKDKNDINNNEDVVEIESENKNDLIEDKMSNQEDKKNEKEKNEKNIMPKKLNTTRIKKISIKRGKNDKKDLSNKVQLNSENIKYNISMSLMTDKNKNQEKNCLSCQKHKQINTVKNKSNYDQTNSFINMKNNLNIFKPAMSENSSEIINNHIFPEKKEK